MSEPPFDVKRANRWFAVELNNLSWDWVEGRPAPGTTAERAIHAAHASCHHWLEAGDVLNHLRAQCLLATVYAKAGVAEAAVRHAERCLALGRETGDAQTAWDRATAHGCAAMAYRIAGDAGRARAEHAEARAAAQQLDDADDRALFVRLYPIDPA